VDFNNRCSDHGSERVHGLKTLACLKLRRQSAQHLLLCSTSCSNHIHHTRSNPSPTLCSHIHARHLVYLQPISHTWTHRYRPSLSASWSSPVPSTIIPTPQHPLHFSSFSPPLTVSSPRTFDDAMNLFIAHQHDPHFIYHPHQREVLYGKLT
jgi:hypothetical protein